MASMTATDSTLCPFAYRVELIRQELRAQLFAFAPAVSGRVEDEFLDAGACLRALLVMLSGEVAELPQDELLPAATAMELLFRAMTGRQQSGSFFQSVLTGEVLYTRALSLVARVHSDAVQVFADLAEHLVAEKWRMREAGLRLETTEQEYFEYVYSKSAIVLANCCKMGALLGNCPSEVVEALTSYGYSFGMAMHIRQDLRALENGASTGAGERIGGSALEIGVLPLAVVHSLQASQRTRLVLSSAAARSQSVSRATLWRCLRDSESIRYTHAVIESYLKKAKASLSVLPASLAKHLLMDLTDRVWSVEDGWVVWVEEVHR